MWPFLLMYGSHDMRHTGFPQVDGGQRDTPGFGASQKWTQGGLQETPKMAHN